MRVVVAAVLLAASCGGSQSGSGPAEPPAPEVTAPRPSPEPTVVAADPEETADRMMPEEPEPPPEPTLVEKLPKPDFAPPLDLTKVDAAKEKEAYKLNVAGLTPHKKKDWAAAEAKYQAALAVNPGHLLARYNLACVYNLSGQSDKGLALLAQLATKPGCDGCAKIVDASRWDNDWRSQWHEPVLWEILALEPESEAESAPAPESESEENEDVLTCPKGTVRKGKWDEGYSSSEYCQKPNGTKHGPYREREEGYELSEGVRGEQGEYRDGKKHGIWYEYASFQGASLGAYVAGAKHGLWIEEARDYMISYDVFVQGKQEARSRTYRESVLILEQHHLQGQLHGAHREWSQDFGDDGPTGDYVLTTEGGYDQGKKHGVWSTYDHARTKRTSERWDHGVAHGKFEYFDATGKLVGEATLDRGTGDWVAYDSDGKLTAKGRLVGGERDGRWVVVDGGTRSEGEWAKGKRIGTWTTYVEPGTRKLEEGAYKAGKRTGPWTYWWSDTDTEVVKAKGAFTGDKPDGAWTVYDEKGELAQELLFSRGKLVKVNGERASKAHVRGYKNSSFDSSPGVIEEWDENWPEPGTY